LKKFRGFTSFLHGNVLVLIISHILWGLPLSIVDPFLSLYVRALGGSSQDIGFVNAMGAFARIILYPVGGYIADHKGRARLVSIITYGLALSFIFHLVAQNWHTLAFGNFVRYLLLFYAPAMNAIMADSLPPNQRGLGYSTANAIPGTVRIIAPYIGGYLIMISGEDSAGVISAMRISYITAILVGLLVATIRFKFLKETLHVVESHVSFREIPTLIIASYRSIWDSLTWLSVTLRSVAIINILITLFISMTAPFWVVYAVEVIGLSAFEWGLVMFVTGVVRVAISIPMGHLTDRYGSRRLILAAFSLAPCAPLLFLFSTSFFGVAISFLLIAIINAIIWPAFSRLMANLIPQIRRGRILSIVGQGVTISYGEVMPGGTLLFLPIALGSLIGGQIYAINPRYLWVLLASAFLVCLLLSFRFINEPKSVET
jgi:MFS family permease